MINILNQLILFLCNLFNQSVLKQIQYILFKLTIKMNKQKKLKVNTPITQSYQSSLVKTTQMQVQSKNIPDTIRHLRNEVERYKNENQDLREEQSHLTQQYLHAKDQVTELLQRLDQMKKQWGGQERVIDSKIQHGIQSSQEQLLTKVEKQKGFIEKLRLEKGYLGKNVWDLQERLKATRHELHLTQKQLYSLQDSLKGSDSIRPEEQVLVIEQQNTRSNRIAHFNGPSDALDNQNKPLDAIMDDKENLSSMNNGLSFKQKMARGGARNGLMVAKSLAVARTTQNTGLDRVDAKYNWLFNDEDTPRDHTEQQQKTISKLVRENKYQANVEDQVTQANSNFQRASGPRIGFNQDENLTDTMQSVRENADDVLLSTNKHRKQDNSQNRESLVGKSLQGMKNMFRKAKEGDFHSLMSRASIGTNSRANMQVIDHQQVELEFEIGNIGQNEENPLDDDSN